MTRRYLVTGGTGFLGSALVRRLVAAGHAVRVLDDNSRGATHRLAACAGKVELIEGDIRNVDAVTKAIKGVDCVVHMAAINGTEFFYQKPESVLDVAVRGILSVIDGCRANGVGDLVIASSSEVYQTPNVVPTPEAVPLVVPNVFNPRYSYGGGKLISELIALNYGRTGFQRVVVFRPHNVYGADMGWEHVIPQFALRAAAATSGRKGQAVDFAIQGTGLQTRAFVHIDDFTDGLLRVVENGRHLTIYNIGTDEEVGIGDLARQVVAIFGCTANLRPSEAPAGGTDRRCPDIARLRTLGYAPKISLAQGLPDVVRWYAENAERAPAA
ncbi:MAG TPA: SDR family NAD(P)-dependent oxidoreductase [Stellaceae bacterium]|nr:SDR family NAD(P)-dependent oxidoreductase [Stellaceae bacterium]